MAVIFATQNGIVASGFSSTIHFTFCYMRWWRHLCKVYSLKHIKLNRKLYIPKKSVLPIPASRRTMSALAFPYPFTSATASASFSQDASVSLFSQWDIVSIIQKLAWCWRFAPIVNKLCCCIINSWPRSSQWASANLALWRTFRMFLWFSSAWNKVKVEYFWPCFSRIGLRFSISQTVRLFTYIHTM